ncbi:uncharacterized protein N7459_009928 [Penicillium hispanicum]|uniref:uncharacterized protein n=1 Tax=Penicillium hispanicum TaxID=1080232 RepID=UPI00254207FE|nr:uncharacterized protein N7459_009928 [Penicillium hispanicum]KAJ5570498.1 hypothetical protein N7459_009928 [Penicillium hispanicum]
MHQETLKTQASPRRGGKHERSEPIIDSHQARKAGMSYRQTDMHDGWTHGHDGEAKLASRVDSGQDPPREKREKNDLGGKSSICHIQLRRRSSSIEDKIGESQPSDRVPMNGLWARIYGP